MTQQEQNEQLIEVNRHLMTIIDRQEKEIVYLINENERLVKSNNLTLEALENNPMAFLAHKDLGH